MSVDEICVGPWPGSPPKGMNYDIGVLGANYDPANVLTCTCRRCGERWSYDSPTAECGYCERETLIEYLTDENHRLQGDPPLYRKPPPHDRYEVVASPLFVSDVAELTGEDEKTTRARMRERGLHLEQARPVGEDRELVELKRWMNEYPALDFDALAEDKQEAWRSWWASREPASPASESTELDKRPGDVGASRGMTEDR